MKTPTDPANYHNKYMSLSGICPSMEHGFSMSEKKTDHSDKIRGDLTTEPEPVWF